MQQVAAPKLTSVEVLLAAPTRAITHPGLGAQLQRLWRTLLPSFMMKSAMRFILVTSMVLFMYGPTKIHLLLLALWTKEPLLLDVDAMLDQRGLFRRCLNCPRIVPLIDIRYYLAPCSCVYAEDSSWRVNSGKFDMHALV